MSRLQHMSGIEKAATVLNVLDKSLASRLLHLFSPDDMARITSISGNLQPISSEEFSGLIEDFASQFADGLQMLGDPREIKGLLDAILTPEQLANINTTPVLTPQIPIWTNEAFANQEILAPLVEREHPQTIAFILSKLAPDLSAKIVGVMVEEKRNDIMIRMLEMKVIQPEIINVVEDHIRVSYIENDAASKGREARGRMAGIINSLEKSQADEFLENLATSDPEEAIELKKLLFAFEDIILLTVKDRLVLFDSVETDVSILALSGCEGELKEMILSSFGNRVRKMIESELANSPDKDPVEVDLARREIARITLDLASRGDIAIIQPEENND